MERISGLFCARCGKTIDNPKRGILYCQESGQPGEPLCLDCYNRQMGPLLGIDLIPSTLPSIHLVDADGVRHTFEFSVRLYPGGVSIESWEPDVDPGYSFQILGDPAECPALYTALKLRMQKALDRKHIKLGSLGRQIAGNVVRGRIEWDPEEDYGDRVPLLVIDGKPYTWNEFGKMLMTFEGFQFRLVIKDRSDEP